MGTQADVGLIDDLQHSATEEAVLQIERDLTRTLPRYLEEEQRHMVRRVLRAFSVKRPDVGYCQGMSFLAAIPLLLGFCEADAFVALCFISEEVCPGYHGRKLEGYFIDITVLSMLVSFMLPEIHCELENQCIQLHMLATDHLLTLSARTWPLNAVARLWDVVLMEGSAALLASFLALLEIYFGAAVAEAKEHSHAAQDELTTSAD